jgi:hypothetical protein
VKFWKGDCDYKNGFVSLSSSVETVGYVYLRPSSHLAQYPARNAVGIPSMRKKKERDAEIRKVMREKRKKERATWTQTQTDTGT